MSCSKNVDECNVGGWVMKGGRAAVESRGGCGVKSERDEDRQWLAMSCYCGIPAAEIQAFSIDSAVHRLSLDLKLISRLSTICLTALTFMQITNYYEMLLAVNYTCLLFVPWYIGFLTFTWQCHRVPTDILNVGLLHKYINHSMNA